MYSARSWILYSCVGLLDDYCIQQEAIEASSFFGEPIVFPTKEQDDSDPLEGAPKVVEGEIKMGNQRHMYMETHRCIAVPKGENGEMDLYSSTQHPSAVQVSIKLPPVKSKCYHKISPR